MEAMKQLLQDDLNRLTDRIAAAVGDQTTASIRSRSPELYQRLEVASGELAHLRGELVDRYAAWLTALEDCATLWEKAEASAEGMTLDRAA